MGNAVRPCPKINNQKGWGRGSVAGLAGVGSQYQTKKRKEKRKNATLAVSELRQHGPGEQPQLSLRPVAELAGCGFRVTMGSTALWGQAGLSRATQLTACPTALLRTKLTPSPPLSSLPPTQAPQPHADRVARPEGTRRPGCDEAAPEIRPDIAPPSFVGSPC